MCIEFGGVLLPMNRTHHSLRGRIRLKQRRIRTLLIQRAQSFAKEHSTECAERLGMRSSELSAQPRAAALYKDLVCSLCPPEGVCLEQPAAFFAFDYFFGIQAGESLAEARYVAGEEFRRRCSPG